MEVLWKGMGERQEWTKTNVRNVKVGVLLVLQGVFALIHPVSHFPLKHRLETDTLPLKQTQWRTCCPAHTSKHIQKILPCLKSAKKVTPRAVISTRSRKQEVCEDDKLSSVLMKLYKIQNKNSESDKTKCKM